MMAAEQAKAQIEQIKRFITGLPAGELARFDVQTHVFEQLAPRWLAPCLKSLISTPIR